MNVVFLMLGKKDHLSGGYEFNFRVVDRLRSEGFEVEVIHYNTVPEGLPEKWLSASFHVLQRIRAAEPDLVIVSKSYQYAPLFRLLHQLVGCPVVFLMHHVEWKDHEGSLRGFLQRQYIKWLLGMADTVWTNSSSSRDMICRAGIPGDRIVVINPGFERREGAPPDRSSREGPVRLLCVGSMSPRKSQHLLVQACAMLDRDHFTIEFAGSTDSDEEYAEKVFRQIEEEHLWDLVSISGQLSQDELADAYRRADILVHPASWEAFGISILEAMWHGLPVVATDVAAIPELVRNEENGLLVTRGDAKELGNAILYLIQNSELRLEMGRRSREFALAQNDWDETCSEFLDMLRETVKESDR